MVEQDIPIVSQSGTYNCLPVSAEAVDKSFGGSITQDELRSLFGGNPNTDGISDVDFWNLYERLSGHEVLPDKFLNDYSATLAVDCMKNGGRVAVNLNTGGNVGHSVVLQRAIRQTVTKINGIQGIAIISM